MSASLDDGQLAITMRGDGSNAARARNSACNGRLSAFSALS
jgi:hypothetical protein